VSIGSALQDVLESAIRHQVARMTIDDALRKRGSINALRLESEQSAIETEKRLAEETTAQQEELARQKHQLEIRRIELEESKLPHEAELDAKRFELQEADARRRLALSKVDQEIEQERIAVANMENAMLTLLRNLPDALKNLKIGDVHLGDPSIAVLLQRIASGMNHRGGLRQPQGEE
jgi:hypothetical protein